MKSCFTLSSRVHTLQVPRLSVRPLVLCHGTAAAPPSPSISSSCTASARSSCVYLACCWSGEIRPRNGKWLKSINEILGGGGGGSGREGQERKMSVRPPAPACSALGKRKRQRRWQKKRNKGGGGFGGGGGGGDSGEIANTRDKAECNCALSHTLSDDGDCGNAPARTRGLAYNDCVMCAKNASAASPLSPLPAPPPHILSALPRDRGEREGEGRGRLTRICISTSE